MFANTLTPPTSWIRTTDGDCFVQFRRASLEPVYFKLIEQYQPGIIMIPSIISLLVTPSTPQNINMRQISHRQETRRCEMELTLQAVAIHFEENQDDLEALIEDVDSSDDCLKLIYFHSFPSQ